MKHLQPILSWNLAKGIQTGSSYSMHQVCHGKVTVTVDIGDNEKGEISLGTAIVKHLYLVDRCCRTIIWPIFCSEECVQCFEDNSAAWAVGRDTGIAFVNNCSYCSNIKMLACMQIFGTSWGVYGGYDTHASKQLIIGHWVENGLFLEKAACFLMMCLIMDVWS